MLILVMQKMLKRINQRRQLLSEVERDVHYGLCFLVWDHNGHLWLDMMKLKMFAKSIYKSAEILKPFGVDLMELICGDDPKALDTIVAPFVAIAAIQIAFS